MEVIKEFLAMILSSCDDKTRKDFTQNIKGDSVLLQEIMGLRTDRVTTEKYLMNEESKHNYTMRNTCSFVADVQYNPVDDLFNTVAVNHYHRRLVVITGEPPMLRVYKEEKEHMTCPIS